MKNLIGSVSHGTMRNDDLIPAFVDLLDSMKEDMSLSVQAGDELRVTAEVSRLDDLLAAIERRQARDDYYESEDAGYDLESLFDELNSLAPPYFYFGAHEGDGSDYGFWLSSDALEDFDGLRVDDLSEVPADYCGEVLHVNDHGNTSLYSCTDGALTEVWAIV